MFEADAECFRQHLNSVDGNIQFTIDMYSKTDKGHSISFLNFRIMHTLSDGSMGFDVYKNKTHTNKYLEMVRTLLNRANLSPLCPERRMNQWKCLLNDLKRESLSSVC